MKKILQGTVILFIVFAFSGCATIFTGTRDTLHFDTEPQGAVVYKDGLKLCTTPCDVSMKRSLNSQYVTFKMDGYRTRMIMLDQEFNVVSVINLGSLIGWAIDAATGAIMKYGLKSYDVPLAKKRRERFEHPKKIEIDTHKKTINVYVVE